MNSLRGMQRNIQLSVKKLRELGDRLTTVDGATPE
jgi:hypothetical protein